MVVLSCTTIILYTLYFYSAIYTVSYLSQKKVIVKSMLLMVANGDNNDVDVVIVT